MFFHYNLGFLQYLWMQLAGSTECKLIAGAKLIDFYEGSGLVSMNKGNELGLTSSVLELCRSFIKFNLSLLCEQEIVMK